MSHLALTQDERIELTRKLTGAIDESGLSLDEFIFATADILKSTFWTGQASGLDEQEINALRGRISAGIEGFVSVLDETTENTAEDMVVISSIMLEAVNHIMSQRQQDGRPVGEVHNETSEV